MPVLLIFVGLFLFVKVTTRDFSLFVEIWALPLIVELIRRVFGAGYSATTEAVYFVAFGKRWQRRPRSEVQRVTVRDHARIGVSQVRVEFTDFSFYPLFTDSEVAPERRKQLADLWSLP